MKTIIPLRLFAIINDVALITYGVGAGLYPVIILQTFLFPLNILRLVQMKRLIKDAQDASEGNHSLQSLIPYMTKEKTGSGDIPFSKGDIAKKMYYIEKGQLLGEIGIVSPYKEKTDTAVCLDSDTKLFSITEESV